MGRAVRPLSARPMAASLRTAGSWSCRASARIGRRSDAVGRRERASRPGDLGPCLAGRARRRSGRGWRPGRPASGRSDTCWRARSPRPACPRRAPGWPGGRPDRSARSRLPPWLCAISSFFSSFKTAIRAGTASLAAGPSPPEGLDRGDGVRLVGDHLDQGRDRPPGRRAEPSQGIGRAAADTFIPVSQGGGQGGQGGRPERSHL